MLSSATIKVVVGQGTPGSMSILTLASDFVPAAIPTYVCYGLCAVMCLISVFTSEKYRDGKVHSFLPILLFHAANYVLISASSNGDIVVLDTSGFPLKAFEACLLAVMVLGFAKRSELIAGVKERKTDRKPASQADELKKYKELLDSGTITQEEFDARKKQLLGL